MPSGSVDSGLSNLKRNTWPLYFDHLSNVSFRGDSVRFESSLLDAVFYVGVDKETKGVLERGVRDGFFFSQKGVIVFPNSFEVVANEILVKGKGSLAPIPDFE